MKNPSHESMVSQVLFTLHRATDADIAAGSNWYRQAHEIAEGIALNGADVTLEESAGILAALSPLTPWQRNVELADRLIVNPGDYLPTLQGNADKARRILDGEDPWQVLTSQKVRAFFEGILYNGETDTVCVDRHALAIAHGGMVPKAQQGMTPRQYAQVAAAYTEVAIQAGMPAAKIQAITWVAWRRQHGIED